ncbi:amino acid adenylation domain-containing protein, partial [Fulvivirgaceae bacterium BMA12]|nr:amino acid adenylation domain-containing protein [Fulvivirgaceae bacterium BMA12]
LNPEILGRVLQSLVARHESLRTVFVEVEGEPRQKILSVEESGFELDYKDLRADPRAIDRAKQIAQREAETPFDLSTGPLLRAKLLQVDTEGYYLLLTVHHIIVDGWSMELLSNEIHILYRSYVSGEAVLLPPLRIQYKDYTYWQERQLSGERLKGHRQYWMDQLSGELPVLELPTDYPRPSLPSLRGKTLEFTFSAETTEGLRQLGQKHNATLFMTVVTLLSSLFYKYTGQRDLIIGTDSAGRLHKDLEDQVGYYLNLLALRIRFSSDTTFSDLLEQVRELVLEVYQHQLYPFDQLLEELQVSRQLGRSPLFDILLIFQDFDGQGQLEEGLFIDPMVIDNGTSLNDLMFEFRQIRGRLRVRLRYNTDLFSHTTIGLLIEHLENLTRLVIACPEQELYRYQLLSAQERLRLLEGFNATDIDYKGSPTLLSLLEKRAMESPHSTALVCQREILTYQELNNRANQLAFYLNTYHAVEGGMLVGLLLPRSNALVIAILAVLKTGAAYLPIDGEYPPARVDFMVRESGLKVLLSERGQLNEQQTGSVFSPELVLLDTLSEQLSTYPESNLSIGHHGDELAYVMYTSGSTGRPKGVMITHAALVDYVQTFSSYFGLSVDDTVLQQSSVAFDTIVEEIFPILSVGGKLVIAREGGRDVEQLVATLGRERVTLLSTTPQVVGEVNKMAEGLEYLRLVISGGDVLKAHYVDNLLERVDVYNTYGPTECTVCSTYQPIRDLSEAATIGKPIANRKVYVLDEYHQPQPVGIVGEILIGGTGLARGYLHQEDLTEEKFISNPFGEGRLYKTGDLGYWNRDGALEYLGRKDDQVKLRGYRIELGEIERVLLEYAGLSQAVVLLQEGLDDEKQIVGYYVKKGEVDEGSLREHLQAWLPVYMVPSVLVELERLPLTVNGKIDKQSLPGIDHLPRQRAYVAPASNTERQLVEIWEQVLGIEEIGVEDNFFELGGHSLKATQLVSYIYKHFSIKLELRSLFTHPTVADLASEMDIIMWAKDTSSNGAGNNKTEEIIL